LTSELKRYTFEAKVSPSELETLTSTLNRLTSELETLTSILDRLTSELEILSLDLGGQLFSPNPSRSKPMTNDQ
jgi:hypothetical protein